MSDRKQWARPPEGKATPHPRAQFICTPQDARAIAQILLRTLAFCEQPADFDAFRERMRSPALQAVARRVGKGG